MNKLAIFASGSGSNAENIVKYFAKRKGEIVVPIIISNKKDAFVHERAKKLGIPSFTCSKKEFEEGDGVLNLLRRYEIDRIILAGFLLKVPENLLKAFPDKIINIHPALLPKFGGKGMYGAYVHEAVAAAKEKISGITIHYVNEQYDEGKIIFQASCEILSTDTASDIAAKVHALEYEHFPRVIEQTLLG
jgi:phosphoribosylglycinamide formyltransferase-1